MSGFAGAMFGAIVFAVVVVVLAWWLARPRPLKRRGKRSRP